MISLSTPISKPEAKVPGAVLLSRGRDSVTRGNRHHSAFLYAGVLLGPGDLLGSCKAISHTSIPPPAAPRKIKYFYLD